MRLNVFITGPYAPLRLPQRSTRENILLAEECAIWCWNNGFNAICPHLNTRDFHLTTTIQDSIYLDFYLDLIKSNFIQMLVHLPNWQDSKGSRTESALARQLSIPRFQWTPNSSTLTIIK